MLNIKPIKLLSGTHCDTARTGQGCFMNVIAYLNGDSQITDNSPCVCVTIRPIVIFLNDFADDNQRQKLLPFVLRAMGTNTNDREVIKTRVAALVEFAEFNSHLVLTFVQSVKSRQATLAYNDTLNVHLSESVDHATYTSKYAAKYVTESVDCAKYARNAADSAQSTAKHAANCINFVLSFSEDKNEFDAIREEVFNSGLKFLEVSCNPESKHCDVIINRANKLIELNRI
jgi:hypothetical protein